MPFLAAGFDPAGTATLAAVLAVAGLGVGLVAGLLGIGGGAILVPVLYEVFGWLEVDAAHRMHMTIATGLAVIVPTSLRAAVVHAGRGAVDMALVRRLSPWIVVGVLLGILFASRVSGGVLIAIWATATTLLILKLVFGKEGWRLGDEIPRHPLVALYAAFVGWLSTLLSIGGGAYLTLLMTLYGRPIHQAVGTSTALAPAIAVPAALGFVWAGWGTTGLPAGSLGYVSLLGAALLVPTSVLAAPWGARLAHGVSRRTLELGLAGFLGLSVARFLFNLAR
jgi:uncharacterized membrane protein YfcA